MLLLFILMTRIVYQQFLCYMSYKCIYIAVILNLFFIHGCNILSHSSIGSGICHLVGMRESFKKEEKIQVIESDSEDEEVAVINISVFKSTQESKTNMSLYQH